MISFLKNLLQSDTRELLDTIESLELKNKKLDSIKAVSSTLVSDLSFEVVTQRVVDLMFSELGYAGGNIFYKHSDSENSYFSPYTSTNNFLSNAAQKLLPFKVTDIKYYIDSNEDNLIIQAYKTKQIAISKSLADFAPPAIKKIAGLIQKVTRVKSILAVPLIYKDEVLGIVDILSQSENFNDMDLEIIRTYADLCAVVINSAQLLQSNQTRVRELSSLYTLTSEITKHLDSKMVAKSAIENIPNDDNLLAEIIFLHDKENKKLILEAYPETEYAEKARAILGQDFKNISLDLTKAGADKNPGVVVLNTMKPIYGKDFRSTLIPTLPGPVATALAKLIPIKSYAIYPIVSHNKALGVILYLFKNEDTIEKMDENTKQLLYTYALQIGISLDNANLFEHSQVIQLNLKKALNELTEARRQERDMIDVMGHELRTPITIVRNALQLMELAYANSGDTIDKKQTSEYLSMALESTKREMVLIETMLTATKVDASRIQLSQEKVDMLDVIHDGLEGQRPAADSKNIQLIWDTPEGDFFAYADRVRVQEIMDNFMSNSVKYTQKGFIEVKIEKKNDKIIVKIKDSGMGIDKSDIENLGKKFFRAKQYINGDESIVRPGGTGLGLYVVFGLIKAMNGEVSVDSKVGEGSTFSFSLPAYTGQKEVKYNEKFLVNDNKKSILKIGGYQKKLENMEKAKSMDSIAKESEDMKHKVEEDNEKILNPK